MKAKKILYITQEIVPYVADSDMSLTGRQLPQEIQSAGREIRTFMPRWGIINERRNQLHEVIRLSGLNIAIDETDHPLIIKVASIQAARMQVYFIDNDEYFLKRKMMCDADGNEYADNEERAVFYARGVLETVKKLRWTPDVIHCHGWISSVIPFFIKTAYADDAPFMDAKVVFSAYGNSPQRTPADNLAASLEFRNAKASLLADKGISLTDPDVLSKLAIAYSDGYVEASEGVPAGIRAEADKQGIPQLILPGLENIAEKYGDFYEKVCE